MLYFIHGDKMSTPRYDDLNIAFCESLFLLNKFGRHVESRGTKQKEVLFFNCVITDPSALSIEVPARKFKPDYAIAEWCWYLSRSPKVKNMANIWLQIQDDNGECESNYGCYLFRGQWQWVQEELLNDKDSRRATIVINQPYHKGKNKKDYPCTQYLHFFIRNNKLHLGVNMRSNDAIFGFCNDVFTFCMFQQLMLNDLNSKLEHKIELGDYHHNAGSFHIYEHHYPMMKKILANYRLKCQNEGYPVLNKFKLKDNITTPAIFNYQLQTRSRTKKQIQQHTQHVKEMIYV